MLTELSIDPLLDQEFEGRHRSERVLNTEVSYVRYLDRLDREDVRLHQPNASVVDLQGYVDHTLPSLLCITMILRVRRKFFEITTFPNTSDKH